MAQKTGLSSNEVANLLMYSPVTVCEWMQNGMLHAEVSGVIKRPFTMGDVAQFARENSKQFNRPDRGKLRVLIVNSDVQSASRLVEILDTLSESTEAVAVHSTFDAGRKITDFRPDVVLVDSQMLRQESLEICRLIKSDHATRHVQIVAVLDPADRDHCLQYMVAIGLLKGNLQAEHYEDNVASDPRVDALREKMEVSEEERFTREYLEPDKRAIGNSLQVFYNDGSSSEEVVVDYPVGHRRRRDEGIPLLKAKFERYLRGHINAKKAEQILTICTDQQTFENTSVTQMLALLQH